MKRSRNAIFKYTIVLGAAMSLSACNMDADGFPVVEVMQHHPFRFAGGAGGIKDIGKVLVRSACGTFFHNIVTVSYTHLDVYKRQLRLQGENFPGHPRREEPGVHVLQKIEGLIVIERSDVTETGYERK